MKSKILIIGGFLACTVLMFGVHLATPSVQSPKDTLEFSMQKAYQFSEAEYPKATTVLKAQLDTTDTSTAVATSTFWDIVKNNWGALLMSFLALCEIYIRATPSESDNSIFNLLKRIVDALIPNKSTYGGVHP